MVKKILLILALLIGNSANSQFLDSTNYRGAFSPDQRMWTEGWCNWNPDTTSYPVTNVSISGNISQNTIWTSNNTYLLSGVVYVDSGVVLTIQPGTVIRGNQNIANSSLLVKRGGRLIAQGTQNNPIVFTSNNTSGNRNLGDWGGIIILGRATMNQGVGYIEGLSAVSDHQYGGSDDNDNSGILSYVRIEYGGYVFAQNKEINGLTLGAVGRGTTIDHIQCSYVNDDAFEWYGGSVNCKYLVSYRNLDDDFDTDFGFHGFVQYGLSVRDPQIADNSFSLPSGSSTSEGFESDNDANGSSLQPFTSATFSNFTMIGPFRGNPNSTVHPAFRRGARIRRNSQLKIINSIISDWATGIMIDGVACDSNASQGSLVVSNNTITNYKTRSAERSSASTFNVLKFIGDNNDTIQASSILIRPYDFSNPDFRLKSLFVKENLSTKEIYPNPARNEINIESTKIQTITFFNLLGQEVDKRRISEGLNTVNLDLPPGKYLIKGENWHYMLVIY